MTKKLLLTFVCFLLFLASQQLEAAVYTTVASGNWNNTGIWNCSCVPMATDDAIIASGHKVTLVSNTTIANLTISSGGIVYNGKNNFTVTGHYIVDGDHVGDDDTYLTGVGTNIGGTGTIHEEDLRVTGNKSIVASANLTKAFGRFRVESATTITNYGTMTIGGKLKASDATSIWTNETGSTLNVKEELFDSTGVLNASAAKNTVKYYGSSDQFIKVPGTSYSYLTLEGGGNKVMVGDIQVDGDLTIASLLTSAGYNIDLYGNWENDKGMFDEDIGGSNGYSQ